MEEFSQGSFSLLKEGCVNALIIVRWFNNHELAKLCLGKGRLSFCLRGADNLLFIGLVAHKLHDNVFGRAEAAPSIAEAGHLGTRLGMIALRSYQVDGALLLVVKAAELSADSICSR